MLKQHEVAHVRYTKNKQVDDVLSVGSVTDRTIIPTFVPPQNIKAIDVSDMCELEQEGVCALLKEYSEYYNTMAKTIFSFNDWLEHTHQIDHSDIKWRTFKLEGLKEVEDE